MPRDDAIHSAWALSQRSLVKYYVPQSCLQANRMKAFSQPRFPLPWWVLLVSSWQQTNQHRNCMKLWLKQIFPSVIPPSILSQYQEKKLIHWPGEELPINIRVHTQGNQGWTWICLVLMASLRTVRLLEKLCLSCSFCIQPLLRKKLTIHCWDCPFGAFYPRKVFAGGEAFGKWLQPNSAAQKSHYHRSSNATSKHVIRT